MHGQKRGRKRTMGGEIVLDGHELKQVLLSEPQATTEHGLIGLRISVQSDDEGHPGPILEDPFPN